MSRSQAVRDLIFGGARRNLILLRPCPALRMCVISSLEVLIEKNLMLATTMFRSQRVRDLVLLKCLSKSDIATTMSRSQFVRGLVF